MEKISGASSTGIPHPPRSSEVQRLTTRMPEFIGNSPALIQLLQEVERIASSDGTVLILGESGTGKELVGARSTASDRGDRAPSSAKVVRRSLPSSSMGNCSAIRRELSPAPQGNEQG